MKVTRTLAIPVLALATALTLRACGGDGKSASSDTVIRSVPPTRTRPGTPSSRWPSSTASPCRPPTSPTTSSANLALSQKQIDLEPVPAPAVPGQLRRLQQRHADPDRLDLIVPLPLYSKKHKTVADIPAGGGDRDPQRPDQPGARADRAAEGRAGEAQTGSTGSQPTPADVDESAIEGRRSPRSTPPRPRRRCSPPTARSSTTTSCDGRHRPEVGPVPRRPEESGRRAVHQRVRRPARTTRTTKLLKLAELYHTAGPAGLARRPRRAPPSKYSAPQADLTDPGSRRQA